LRVPRQFRLRLVIGVAAVALLIYGIARTAALRPKQETGLLPTHPPTSYIHYFSDDASNQRVLVVHGLDSNKEFMQIFCAALADADFEVYAIDLPGHGDSTANFNGVLASNVIEQTVALLKPDIAIGHSMGAALLIDLAHQVKFGKLVLVSPVPTVVGDLHFENTLVTTETWDIPAVNAFAPMLQGADLKKWPGMHSSALIKTYQIREIVMWLGGDPARLRTSQRLVWLGLMYAGAAALGIVLFPGLAAGVRREPLFSKTEIALAFIAASAVSVVVNRFVVVLRWVQLFAMDYTISFWFVAGLTLLVILSARTKKWILGNSVDILRGLAAAAYVIIVMGLLAGSHLIHMTLPDGRWWRFIVIAAAGFPLFLFDEAATPRVGSAWQNAGIAFVTRSLITASLATGVLLFNRESAFIVLVLPLLFLFWMMLWFVTGFVARNAQNPAGAALFAALVQGWMFAAWFVIV
jgi:pimeloyl-ACP methyl ester carboxylesterase